MIREFGVGDPAAKKPLGEWFSRLKATTAKSFAELKLTFPSADQVGTCTVFNIGGNKYRVIAKIVYRFQTVYLRSVMSHKEYDKDKWKADCNKKT